MPSISVFLFRGCTLRTLLILVVCAHLLETRVGLGDGGGGRNGMGYIMCVCVCWSSGASLRDLSRDLGKLSLSFSFGVDF